MRFRNIVTLLTFIIVTACSWRQEPVTYYMTETFNPGEHEIALQEGTGRIEGQAFIARTSGIPLLASGVEVYLFPRTGYSGEYVAHAMFARQQIENLDPGFHRYIRSTIANAEGRFTFEGIAPGPYAVACQVQTSGDHYNGVPVDLATLHGMVDVRDGDTATVAVTR